MADFLKVLGSEITLTSANTVGNANIVRLVNADTANSVVITQKFSNGATRGTFTLGNFNTSFSREYFIKDPTDTIEVTGTATIKAVSVAYK